MKGSWIGIQRMMPRYVDDDGTGIGPASEAIRAPRGDVMNLFRLAIPLLGFVWSGISAHGASLPEMQGSTAAIATRYLQVWSSNNVASVESVPYVYGPRVQFYGQSYTQGQLMAEKRRAIHAWPIRRYVHRPGSMQVICNVPEQKCAARSIIDFQIESPRRRAAKRGSARFDLGISFAGPRPRILYEGGSLNKRRG